MTKSLRSLGLMSGTSLDGIDVAMLTTDGEDSVERGPSATYPYPPEFRSQLRQALADATSMTQRRQRPGCLAEVERELTERHAAAVTTFLAAHTIDPASIDIIGFHGQTVLHRPENQLTVQLGDGWNLARLTGRDVVYDLRAADVAAYGWGAPLVPVYHRALAAEVPQRPIAFLNVGGVANVTWIGRSGELVAFDTGPGNALIDDFVRGRTGQPFDDGGQLAAQGVVDEGIVHRFLAHPYFSAPPPKALDRDTFAPALPAAMTTPDGVATLAACTIGAVARAVAWLPAPPELWVVCGGGRHNRGLMVALAAALDGVVAPAEALSLNGDSLEAEAWAYLAVRSLRGLPISFPMTTGVAVPMTGGVLARGRA
jgi:anhydro-N-acetylmuramic acid kinase